MTQKWKLLILLEATAGGTRKYIIDFLERIDLERYEVVFAYSLTRADALFVEALPGLQQRGIRLVEIPMVRGISIKSDALGFWEMLKLIRAERPDIVHGHSSKAGLLSRLAAKLSLVKTLTIFTPHGLSTHVSFKYWLIEKVASWFTDVAIAVSSSEYLDFQNQRLFHERNSRLITLGLDCNKQYQPFAIRQHLGISEKAVVVASVGFLSDVKNPIGLLEIAKIVVSFNSNIHFIWVGDGHLREQAQAFINDNGLASNCHLFGWHPTPQSILEQCDIFALTSHYESFGYVMCEAMLTELPVVATNVMGPRTVVDDKVTGYLVTNGDWQAFANIILKLGAQPELRAQLGRVGRKRVTELFCIDKMVSATEDLYEDVVMSRQDATRFLAQ